MQGVTLIWVRWSRSAWDGHALSLSRSRTAGMPTGPRRCGHAAPLAALGSTPARRTVRRVCWPGHRGRRRGGSRLSGDAAAAAGDRDVRPLRRAAPRRTDAMTTPPHPSGPPEPERNPAGPDVPLVTANRRDAQRTECAVVRTAPRHLSGSVNPGGAAQAELRRATQTTVVDTSTSSAANGLAQARIVAHGFQCRRNSTSVWWCAKPSCR